MNPVSGSPSIETLNEMVRRIVAAVHPLRLVLFGSAAIARMGPNSDLDLLVVMPDGVHRRQTSQKIYRSLSGIGIAKDIIVVTESDIHKHKDNPSLIIYPALREGRELYHAKAK
ncbi:MAG: nucleotidyltransferase domain-containing protein [bacterium]